MNHNISSDIPRDLRDVLSDISYLSRLPTSQKYMIHNRTYALANSWIQTGIRTYFEETKSKSIDFINKTIDRAVEAGRKYPNWIPSLSQKLSDMSNALTNMTHTYIQKYPDIESDIEIIRLRIDPRAFEQACQEKPTEPINPLIQPSRRQEDSSREFTPSSPSSYSHPSPSPILSSTSPIHRVLNSSPASNVNSLPEMESLSLYQNLLPTVNSNPPPEPVVNLDLPHVDHVEQDVFANLYDEDETAVTETLEQENKSSSNGISSNSNEDDDDEYE